MSKIKTWDELSEVPHAPCEYKLFKERELVRNGSSCDCQRRLKEHRRAIPEATGFKIHQVEDCLLAREAEKAFCLRRKPPLNKRCG